MFIRKSGLPEDLRHAVYCERCQSLDLQERRGRQDEGQAFRVLKCQMCANVMPLCEAVPVTTPKRKDNRDKNTKMFPELFRERQQKISKRGA